MPHGGSFNDVTLARLMRRAQIRSPLARIQRTCYLSYSRHPLKALERFTVGLNRHRNLDVNALTAAISAVLCQFPADKCKWLLTIFATIRTHLYRLVKIHISTQICFGLQQFEREMALPCQCAVQPPSTGNDAPVSWAASCEHKNTARAPSWSTVTNCLVACA